jgi:hypothetical protein
MASHIHKKIIKASFEATTNFRNENISLIRNSEKPEKK